jgi:hypothetical protein
MRSSKEIEQSSVGKASRLKAWVALFLCIFLIWGFIFYAGPWIRDGIPLMKQLTVAVKERDIDTTTFFYSETKESYEAEQYLRDSLDLAQPKGYGYDFLFFAGIGICFIILAAGFYFMPVTVNENPKKPSNNN